MLTSPPPLPWNSSKDRCTHRCDITAHTKECHSTHHRVPTPQSMPQPAKHPTNNGSCQTTQPAKQHPIRPTPATTRNENTAQRRAHHVTTTHYPLTQYNTPCHCIVQDTIVDHTPQQTPTQHTTPLYTLGDHSIVMWCGQVSCGVVWCQVVWCGVMRYRAIGLSVWLVEGCVGCLAGGVVWQLGLLGVWLGGARCVVCAFCGVRYRRLLCAA